MEYIEKKKVVKGRFQLRILVSILLVIAIPVVLTAIHFLTKLLTDEGEIFHWLPIVLSAVACIFGGAVAGSCFYETEFWTEDCSSELYYKWIYEPIGKTVGEMDDVVKKHYKKDEYNVSDLTIIISFLVFDLAVIVISLFVSIYALNFLVAFPVWIVFAIVSRTPSGQDYVKTVRGNDWEEYVCPHCGGICGKFDYKRKNADESVGLGSRYVTVTDEYTNGVDSIYVDRKEKEYYVEKKSAWDEEYRCPRCKKTFDKHFSYTREI